MKTTLAIIILAAGEASRMGQAKQLLELNGQTLLHRCLAKAIALPVETVVTVLGAHLAQTQPVVAAFDKRVHYVVNPTWANGMGSSVAQGINKVLEVNPATNASLILLADQPLVSLAKLHEMLEFYENKAKPIVASAYDNTFGVPAIFERSMFEALQQLKGKAGAKKVMKQHLKQLAKFDLPEAAFDVDTPEDFAQIQAMF